MINYIVHFKPNKGPILVEGWEEYDDAHRSLVGYANGVYTHVGNGSYEWEIKFPGGSAWLAMVELNRSKHEHVEKFESEQITMFD